MNQNNIQDAHPPLQGTKFRNPRGGVQNTRERGLVKLAMVLEWLAVFQFSTVPLLAKRLGIHERTMRGLIQKLKHQKLIQGLDVDVIPRELLVLTTDGLTAAMMFTERLFVMKGDLETIQFSKLNHDLLVQSAVLQRLQLGVRFLSEHQLEYLGRQKRPDALIEMTNGKLAIEVEITPKTDARIYLGFEQYVKALHEGIYTSVEYFFRTDTLLQYYQRRFENAEWPVYTYNDKHKRWVLRRDAQQKTVYFYPRENQDLVSRIVLSRLAE